MEEFVHLHVHSCFSLLDSSVSIDELIDRTLFVGQKALALTDDGNSTGLYYFQEQCIKKGIKPILGQQFYVVKNHLEKEDSEERKTIVLLVKNKIGWKNLCILSSESYTEGNNVIPRIDYNLLKKYKDGLILLSGGIDGHFAHEIIYMKLDKAKKLLEFYKNLFGNDFYVEIMKHPNPTVPSAEELEKRIYEESFKLAEELGIKCVSTNDVKYSYKYKKCVDAQDVMNCVKQHKTKKDDTRRTSYPCDQYYLKTRKEMEELFLDRLDICDNTIEVLNKIEDNIIGKNLPLLPKFVAPNAISSEEYLKNIVYGGLKTKGFSENKEYVDRIEWELKVFIACGFIDYFLILHDFVSYAIKNGIPIGPGRGSCVGSLALYCMGITKCNPIKFGLLFERFLSVDAKCSIPFHSLGLTIEDKEIELPKDMQSNLVAKCSKHPEYNKQRMIFEGKQMKELKCFDSFLKSFYLFEQSESNIGNLNYHNSCIAYYSGMTSQRPIGEFKPLEELAAARISPPDVDLDFDYHRRDEIFAYLRQKYGDKRAVQIGTSMFYKAKMLIKDVGKALDIGNDFEKNQEIKIENDKKKAYGEKVVSERSKESIKLTSLIADTAPDGLSFAESYKESEALRQNIPDNTDYYHICTQFDGLVRQFGIHAAGMILSNTDIREVTPLKVSSEKICTQWDKEEVEKLGFCKYDLLALINISIIADTLKLIKENHDIDIDIDAIDVEDKNVLKMLSDGFTAGVFQFDTFGGTALLKSIGADAFKDLVVCNAINRPGPRQAGVDVSYADFKHQRKEITYLHPSMESVLEETYGLIVYQEQIMNLAKVMASFSKSEADKLRKCVTDDTLFVSKKRGWISIKNLLKDGYADDLFLNMDEKGQLRWSKIKDIWCTGKHNVHTVETRSGFNVNATQYHQFLTDDGWKARCRLQEDDYMVCAHKVEYDGQDIISEDLAIVIAGLLTEGYFIDNVSRFTSFDAKFMNIFIKHFNNCFGDVGRLSDDGKVFYIHKNERDIINKYLPFGLSVTKKIPDVMMGMTYDSTKSFLSFMFGAECGVSKNGGNLEYSSKSKIMIDQVKLLLLRYGITSFIYEKNVKGYGTYYRLYVNDVEDQKILLDELSHLWPESKRNDLVNSISNKTEKLYTANVIPKRIVKKIIDQYPFVTNGEGGSIYSSNISKNRFLRIAEKTCDKKIIEMSNGNQFYDELKSTNKVHNKSINTYDFTMENCEEPHIIANGMVIHNSIGKKDLEMMATMKSKFVDGCISNAIEKSIAEKVWNEIEYFGGYGFNKSHSVAYSFLGYQEAWLKYYYPLEFFCCLFTSAIGNEEKFNSYRLEASGDKKLGKVGLGVQLWSVNINKSLDKYYIDRDGLRLPLSHVDGVGENAVRAIMSAQPFNDFEDFVNRVDTRVVNVNIVRNLAKRKFNAFACFGISEEEAVNKFELIKKDISKRKISKSRFVGGSVLEDAKVLFTR